MSELNALGKTEECTNQVSDKVRLITYSEYYNMSPLYKITDSTYPNVENITKATGNYTSWLYCSSTNCGNSKGNWWTMGSYSNASALHVRIARSVQGVGALDYDYGERANGVRPVITIVK